MKPERQHVLRSLLATLQYIEGRNLTIGKHHLLFNELAYKLMRGDIKRLIIEAPPQHGKSTAWSHAFPVFWLGNNPNDNVIITSYEATQAARWSGKVRRTLRTNKDLFGIDFAKDTDALTEFSNYRGSIKSAGVGGAITGSPADVLIIDDPIKNHIEANSPLTRNSIYEWWDSVAQTRLSENAIVIIIMTRWNEDDLVGRLTTKFPETWHRVSLPALAEDGDILGREFNEPLYPLKHSKESLLKKKRTTSSYWFLSMYQQKPKNYENQIIKRHWWGRYTDLPAADYIIQAWDTAFKDNESNDYCCCATLRLSKGNIYLVNLLMERMEFPELLQATISQGLTYRPNEIVIENKASGPSLQQVVKRTTKFPIKLINEDGDKTYRLHLASPLWENGRVFVPDGAEWVEKTINRFAQFPNLEHDDDIDAVGLGIRYLENKFRLLTSLNPETVSETSSRRRRERENSHNERRERKNRTSDVLNGYQ